MDWLIGLALLILVGALVEHEHKKTEPQRKAAKFWDDVRAQDRKDAIARRAQAAPKSTPYSRSHISARLRADVLRRDKSTCQHCGAQAPNVQVHVDHKVPASKGGTTTLSNLQVLCAECNLGKGNRFTG